MDNQVGFDGFQVSNQCMALVRDDCLVPTIDEPGLGYIRESSSDQYVPDVFYKVGIKWWREWNLADPFEPRVHSTVRAYLLQATDSYGNEVTQLARPMPIEYVLVQVCKHIYYVSQVNLWLTNFSLNSKRK